MSSLLHVTKDDRVTKNDLISEDVLVTEEDPIAEEELLAEEDAVSEGNPIADGNAGALPFEERVRQRAHRLYLSRGDEPRSALDDWLRAEEEIRLEDQRQNAAL